jgi:hypothetical protein
MQVSVQKYHNKQDRGKGAELKYCSGCAMFMNVIEVHGEKTGNSSNSKISSCLLQIIPDLFKLLQANFRTILNYIN